MTKECAFCPSTAKLTGEHLWSKWMSELLPGRKIFRSRNQAGKVTKEWQQPSLDWKAKVVCESCNTGWMSNVESQHAKPAMGDLVLGKKGIDIPQSRANSIAIFAFKTAVVFEHLRRDSSPFFARDTRFRFRESLEIPFTVRMWMAEFEPRGSGHAITYYHQGHPGTQKTIELYVCSFSCEHFCFQVVAEKWPSGAFLSSRAKFERLAVPFWPEIPIGFIWPAPLALKSITDFSKFASRWNYLDISLPAGTV
jgi:hypothetical protein